VRSNADAVRAVYDRQAAVFDAQRSKVLFERTWLERFAEPLAEGARVLDLGCGSGEPIARWLMDQCFSVTGIDFSEQMLALARARWPDGDWRQTDMRELNLGEAFDGIVAWNSFFHLTGPEQETCIASLADHLRPGGTLLLTVGPEAGETCGHVGPEEVYHASLSPGGYRNAMTAHGLEVTGFVTNDPETQNHSVLMARKRPNEANS